MYYVLCTMYYLLFTIYYVLCTMYYVKKRLKIQTKDREWAMFKFRPNFDREITKYGKLVKQYKQIAAKYEK